jgi:predicted  nucleic acid-binding Zn-ribbon protein
MTRPDLAALLRVQDRDTGLDRLRYRRSTIPEREMIRERRVVEAQLSAAAGATRGERDETLVEERRLDDEAQSLARRAKEVDGRLYSGTVSSPRELQAMQADIEQLDRHRSKIEEQELDVMERRESLDAALAALEAQLAGVRAELRDLDAKLAASEAEIDAEIAVEEAARAEEAAAVGPDLLADFERRRVQNRGAGVALLVGDTCQGCRLSIPATEVDRLRHDPEAGIASCDNCGAILVPAGPE